MYLSQKRLEQEQNGRKFGITVNDHNTKNLKISKSPNFEKFQTFRKISKKLKFALISKIERNGRKFWITYMVNYQHKSC